MIVLDTNVISEFMKPVPADQVLVWLARLPLSRLFITAITQAEILYGVELLPKGKRREALASVVAGILEADFANRILPFDSDAAQMYALVATECRAAGRSISYPDAQIAAIARSRGAAVATRNIPDFENCGVPLLNPWI